MSFSRTKANKEHHRALQAFAESEAVSGEDSDDDFDIIESSRKELNLSQYIEGKLKLCGYNKPTNTDNTQHSHKHRLSHSTLITRPLV
jgi:hypothetical protein